MRPTHILLNLQNLHECEVISVPVILHFLFVTILVLVCLSVYMFFLFVFYNHMSCENILCWTLYTVCIFNDLHGCLVSIYEICFLFVTPFYVAFVTFVFPPVLL